MLQPRPDAGGLDTATLAGWRRQLGGLDRAVGDAERIEQLRALEELKAAAAAAQAVVTADLVASQVAEQRAAGLPERDRGAGVAAQVALARRESPHRGSRLVGLAQALVAEMPATMAALQAGQISEWRATLVARETACLTREDRRVADAELAGRLADLGDRGCEAAARAVAYRLDPHAFTARSKGAVGDRRVTLRPAPDTMSRLSGLLPVASGVAAFAALSRQADGLKAAGDERSRGQIMADTLVERLTGQTTAAAVPVEIELVMTDSTLLADTDTDTNIDTGTGTDIDSDTGTDTDAGGWADEPAHLVGFGPVPAPVASDLVRDTQAGVWVRRVFTRPADGALVGMESRRRLFPDRLRRFLVLRDQTCRTPWCGAPIRHADHVVPAETGGPTSEANGQGLCVACNLAKQAPGWQARPGPGGAGQTVTITTPTRNTDTSRPPPSPGQPPPAPRRRSRARPPAAGHPPHQRARSETAPAA
jgi:hypothetical protein